MTALDLVPASSARLPMGWLPRRFSGGPRPRVAPRPIAREKNDRKKLDPWMEFNRICGRLTPPYVATVQPGRGRPRVRFKSASDYNAGLGFEDGSG